MTKKWSVLLMAMVVALTALITPLNAKAQAEQRINELWDEEDFAVAELIFDHLNVYTDSEGNEIMEIQNVDALDESLRALNADIDALELESTINNFNELITSGDENAVTDYNEHVASELDAIQTEMNGEVSADAISCSDALSIIGFVHAGSYGAAALALGITGGLSFTIPLIISAAYTAASLACD